MRQVSVFNKNTRIITNEFISRNLVAKQVNNVESKILHYNICLYIYRLCMSHIVGLLYSEYEYIPGILIQVSQHITIIRLTRIIICNKMNTIWENGQQLIYILKWRYKIA